MRECFPLDSHVFVLVLELCEGETLDTRIPDAEETHPNITPIYTLL